MPDDNRETFAALLPFMATASEGGPFDDRAFSAGFQVGQIDAALMVTDAAVIGPVGALAALLGQLDLVAMRHRFTLEAAPFPDDEEWLSYTFRRDAAEEPPA